MAKAFNRAIKIAGETQSIGGNVVKVIEYDVNGHVLLASGTTVPTAASAGFAKGCVFIDTDVATGTSGRYENIGTTASCNFVNAVTTAMIADGAVTYAKRSVVGAATATADGLTTGLILDGETFVTVTSDSATKLITLPACAAAGIGQTIDLYVGATGFELVTPASSGDTINTVDSDGTNQLDVAANSLVHLIQVSATGWFAYLHAATTITVVAPDND